STWLFRSLGASTSSISAGDVVVMLGAAALGVACIRYDWPRVPFLLAVVLGSLAGRYLFLSLSLCGWSWLSRPIVVVIGLAMATTILVPAIRRRRARRAARATTGEAV